MTSSLYSALSLISDKRWGRVGGTEILRLPGTVGDEAEMWVGEERGDRAGGGGGGWVNLKPCNLLIIKVNKIFIFHSREVW